MSLISLSLAVIFNIILPTFKNSQRWRQLRCCNGCSMERRSYPWWFCSWTAEWVHPPTFAGRQCSWISSGLWIDKAHTLDEARKNCEVYRLSADSNSFHLSDFGALCNPGEENSAPTQCLPMETKCCFWSKQRHPRFKCLAQDWVCYKWKKGQLSIFGLSESKNRAPTAGLTGNSHPCLLLLQWTLMMTRQMYSP